MSELRLYLRRDSLLEGTECDWALLDDACHLLASGTRLEEAPKVNLCRLVLAGDLVLSLKAPLPDLPERRLTPLLATAAESMALMDADLLHAVLMERLDDGEASLAVIEAAWLRRILARLEELGLKPDAALPDYLMLPWTEGNWSLACGSRDTLVRFDRTQGMVLDETLPPVGLILALSQRPRPEKIQVYQGDGGPDWRRWGLEIPMEAADRWDSRTACWPDLPNLLQGRHAPSRNRLEWKRLMPLAWGVAALLLIQFSGLLLDWALLARESASLQQEARGLAERALPAHAAIVDPAWQVAQRLVQLHTAAGTPPADACVGLLRRLGQVWPVGAQVQSLNYEGDTLGVFLAAADPEWIDRLQAAAALRGLAVSSVQDGKGIRLNVRAAKVQHGR